jgi:ubiquinone/menaquinone biosynthesis C-methylase UbiE
MKKVVLPNDGERMIPEYHKGWMMYGEHLIRYEGINKAIEGRVVLDIACGSGYGSSMLASSAKKVIGVDIDENTVQYAKQNYGSPKVTFLQGRATAIPIEDSSVDVVVSYETVEHVKEYKKFLSEIKRVLKPKGLLIISTPNDKVYIEDNPFHQHEFVFSELSSLLKINFKNVKPYFQSTWLYSTLFDEDLVKKEWQNNIKTINTIADDPERATYFIMLGSDGKLPVLEPISGISQKWSEKDEREKDKKIVLTEQHAKNLETKIAHLERSLDAITSSKTYKLSEKLANLKRKKLNN